VIVLFDPEALAEGKSVAAGNFTPLTLFMMMLSQ
jgi:hypothetical protein